MKNMFDIAAFGSYEEMLQILKGAPISINREFDEFGSTLAGRAASFGNIDTLEALSQAGADLNACDGDRCGEPPLHSAIRHGHLDVVKYLLEKRVDLDKQGWMGITGRERLRELLFHNPDAIPARYSEGLGIDYTWRGKERTDEFGV